MTEYPPPDQPYGQPDYPAPSYEHPPYEHPPYETPPYGTPQYEHPPYGTYGTYGGAPYGQYPPPQGWPSAPYGQQPGPRRLDGWSVAGLVCGILPTVVLGLIFSVIGLVRTGNPLRRGRALALVGLVLSLAWFAGLAALGAYAEHRQATAAPAVSVNPMDLAVGDCFQQPTLTTQVTVPAVPKVPCKQLHNAVVVATVYPTNTDYPGLSTILDQAVALCNTEVRNYLGRSLGRLRYAAFAPHQALWESGQKFATCVLYDPDHNFKGDIRKDR